MILIAKPRSANRALVNALGLKSIKGASLTSTASDIRDLVGKEVWEGYNKLMVFVETTQLFQSAVYAIYSGEWEATSDFSKEIKSQNTLQEATQYAIDNMPKCKKYIEAVFWDQNYWVDSKIDTRVARLDIASYFNHTGIGFIKRENFAKAYVNLTKPQMLEIRKLYEEDVRFLEKTPMWSWNEKMIRLVTGDCPTCMQKVKDKEEKEEKVSSKKPRQVKRRSSSKKGQLFRSTKSKPRQAE